MVNSDGTIEGRKTINGNEYIVISTEAYGGLWQTKDTIKSVTTGRVMTLSRLDWKKKFDAMAKSKK